MFDARLPQSINTPYRHLPEQAMNINLSESTPIELPFQREQELKPIASEEWIIRWPEFRTDEGRPLRTEENGCAAIKLLLQPGKPSITSLQLSLRCSGDFFSFSDNREEYVR